MYRKRFLLLLISVFFLTATQACGNTDEVSQPEITEEEIIRKYVEGVPVVVYGPEDFRAYTTGNLETAGMVVEQATTFDEAARLADAHNTGFVEIQCIQPGDEKAIVIHATKAEGANIQGLMECEKGLILIGTYTVAVPDMEVR